MYFSRVSPIVIDVIICDRCRRTLRNLVCFIGLVFGLRRVTGSVVLYLFWMVILFGVSLSCVGFSFSCGLCVILTVVLFGACFG